MKKQHYNLLLAFIFVAMFGFSWYQFIQMRKMPPYVNPMSFEEVWKHEKEKMLEDFREIVKENAVLIDSTKKEVNQTLQHSFHDIYDRYEWESYHGRRRLKPTPEQLDSLKKNNNEFLFPFNIYLNWNSNWEHHLNVPHYGMSDGKYGFIFSIHYKEIYYIKLTHSYGERYHMEVTNSSGKPVIDFPEFTSIYLDQPDKEKYGTLQNAREEYLKSPFAITY